MKLEHGTWDGDWKSELSEIREEIADDIHRFRSLDERERHALRSRLRRTHPEELHADIDHAFEMAMRPSPIRPRGDVGVNASTSQKRPRRVQRERRTHSTVSHDNATLDDDPPRPLVLQRRSARPGEERNDADLLAPSLPLTDSEKTFMAGLAELALQATLGDFQRHAEENKSKEGGAS